MDWNKDSLASFWIFFFCSVANTVVQSSCPEMIVKREILNKGFHRNLITRLEIHDLAEDNDCRIIFQESIPSGLFVDPYQLSSLQQHNLTEVLLLKAVDLEAPEYLSTGFTALVYANADPACKHCFISTIPVHARYHRPSSKNYESSSILISPRLLVHCSKEVFSKGCSPNSVTEAPCGSKGGSSCHWLDINYTAVPKTVALHTPVGITQHGPAVCSITLITTLYCTGMILQAVYRSSHLV
ncbi:phosphatidylinositol-glycan biosynthesis class X protein [Bombina bombina]|uniref:phosphatidylinositol-glycan biosynthesis class X protein n=1 Tax=Bombina bombina TaxID=8345 RepID=UPI00235ABA60|nr:phosphatidylinositol-glycan biosynthesis class X protein [Bombina bombina]XP_053565779.1 phosphatidylinositol-glycan biosynthesis class X protein [Bombina bombina]XP_053565780.1 phosphatidylinositol-glycan biosynthesis class X protein [Bombina bombina]XP_053565781.1 phosphatidylinositol-glycan biosynthesis class X protein [Bombina bombina]XP_053565782.1 phosphatidylinositol-glycan biosynthesis class X protein [Bombina bombina]